MRRRRRSDEREDGADADMREDVRLSRLVLFDARTQAWRIVAGGPAWYLFELAASRSEPSRVVAIEDGAILYAYPGDQCRRTC